MTHDTPGDNHGARRWCERCHIAVEPEQGPSGPECPACGGDLDGG